MKKQFMAIDQYGQTFHGLTHPRKDLMKKMGCKHADKMYQDKEDGSTVHVGYIISDHWFTLYEVTPYQGEV